MHPAFAIDHHPFTATWRPTDFGIPSSLAKPLPVSGGPSACSHLRHLMTSVRSLLYHGSIGSVLMVAIWHAVRLLAASKAGRTSANPHRPAVIAFALILLISTVPGDSRYEEKQY